MTRSNNFLDFHARKGTGFLHPGGIALTELLIKKLAPGKNLRVLEVGCGTGATVVRLTKNHQTRSTAVDFSDRMLQSAKQRAWWSGVSKQIQFKKVSGDGLLPFPDKSFDTVYSESVLAIVDEHILLQLLKEISRVLVPGGKFISNDAIWKADSTAADIERINTACLRDFGIVQSIGSPAYKSDWIELFEQSGFSVLEVINTKEAKLDWSATGRIDWYKLFKRTMDLFKPFLFYRQRRFKQLLNKAHQHDGDFIESYLFVMRNEKSTLQNTSLF